LAIFDYFTSSVTVFGSLTWISILASHVGFMRGMKAQGLSRDTLPYKAPFQPYLTYFALFFTCALTFFKGFDSFMPFAYKTFITHYIGIPVYVFGYLGYKLIRKTKAVKMHEMDLSTGSREFADLDGEDEDDGYADMNWKQKAVYNLKNW